MWMPYTPHRNKQETYKIDDGVLENLSDLIIDCKSVVLNICIHRKIVL